MASYCTPDDLLELIGAPVRWGTAPAPAETTVDDLIERKSDIIDGKCRDRYTVPFAAPPKLIIDTCVQLVLADLLPIIYFNSDAQLARAKLLSAAAAATLADIQAGRLSLEDDDQASQGMGGQVTYTVPTDERIFTRDQDY
jgi:phage gp36-like protein